MLDFDILLPVPACYLMTALSDERSKRSNCKKPKCQNGRSAKSPNVKTVELQEAQMSKRSNCKKHKCQNGRTAKSPNVKTLELQEAQMSKRSNCKKPKMSKRSNCKKPKILGKFEK